MIRCSRHQWFSLLAAAGLLLSLNLRADEAKPLSAEAADFFEKKVRPVLANRCYECHSTEAKKIKGGLLLDTREATLKGGDNGPALVPGDPDKSLLIKAVLYKDENLQMPPKHPLEPQEIAALQEWVKMGAPDPRTGSNAAKLAERASADLEEARKFWSFHPVQNPAVPTVKNTKWARTDIDKFILAKWEEKKLTPNAEADKRTLIRRATFDLTGLPPTPEEVNAFLTDKSPQAFEKVVNRLLASSSYGERWGRHWLDLVRYADTSGCNSDYPVPTAYKYRNYVIESFNADKPYDEFVREQIAGDLLPAKSEADKFENTIATGYLAITRRFGSRASEFHLSIEDTIDNVGKTVLGLTVSCARCHDHKFDPISAKDYYALYGIFNSTRYAFPGTEIYKHPKDFVPLASEEESKEYFKNATDLALLDDRIEKLQERKVQLERVTNVVAAVQVKPEAANNQSSPEPDKKPAEKVAEAKPAEAAKPAPKPPSGRPPERKDLIKIPEEWSLMEVKAELEDARLKQRQLENRVFNTLFEKAYAVFDDQPGNARIQKKGDPGSQGDEVPRGFPAVLGGQQVPAESKESGRRELAEWLTARDNPLFARVMVNRIWQYHFGKGIVQTPNDFGTRGKTPTHPELLDYLATRFIESNWSVKTMHKAIMLSRVYQLSAADNPRQTEMDVNNDNFWKFNRRRLSAEEVRDSMLAISGELDRAMGGPHPFPPETQWRYTQHVPFVAYYDTDKRSVYMMQQRIKKHPYLEIFDGADPNAPTADRSLSTTPIQALFMMNNDFVYRQADQLAVRVGMAERSDAERIRYAYELVLGRPASRDEVKLGEQYLKECRTTLQKVATPSDQQRRAALASYARVLFSSNEFIYVD